MKKMKNNKGITGVDITISIIILALFISLITSMFYNVTIIGKSINRKSDAVYIAVQVIEAVKQLGYSELPTGDNAGTSIYTLEELCEMIYAGKLQDSKTVSAIMAYSNMVKSKENNI